MKQRPEATACGGALRTALRAALTAGADQLPEELPVGAAVACELHLVHREVVVRRRLEADSRQEERIGLVEMGGRAEQAFAREVAPRLPQRGGDGVRDGHAVVVEDVVGLRIRKETLEYRLVEPDGLVL